MVTDLARSMRTGFVLMCVGHAGLVVGCCECILNVTFDYSAFVDENVSMCYLAAV